MGSKSDLKQKTNLVSFLSSLEIGAHGEDCISLLYSPLGFIKRQ